MYADVQREVQPEGDIETRLSEALEQDHRSGPSSDDDEVEKYSSGDSEDSSESSESDEDDTLFAVASEQAVTTGSGVSNVSTPSGVFRPVDTYYCKEGTYTSVYLSCGSYFRLCLLQTLLDGSTMTEAARIQLVAQATIASRVPRALWNGMQCMPGQQLLPGVFPSNYLLSKALTQQAKLNVRRIDCCVNGCRAFTRSYSKDTACHSCKQSRYDSRVRLIDRVQLLTTI